MKKLNFANFKFLNIPIGTLNSFRFCVIDANCPNPHFDEKIG